MSQGNIAVQSTSTIMGVGKFSLVRLLPLVDRSSPPYITGISDQDYLALMAGYSQAVGGGNFLLQLLKHSSSLAVHLHGVVFLIRSVRGAEE